MSKRGRKPGFKHSPETRAKISMSHSTSETLFNLSRYKDVRETIEVLREEIEKLKINVKSNKEVPEKKEPTVEQAVNDVKLSSTEVRVINWFRKLDPTGQMYRQIISML